MGLHTCAINTIRLDCKLVVSRDVPGKERKKTGLGKKRERTLFFPFPFLHLLAPFVPFLAKS